MNRTPIIFRWQLWFMVIALLLLAHEANVYITHTASWAVQIGFAGTSTPAVQ